MGAAVDALRAALRGHGYVDGKNVALEVLWGDGDSQRLRRLAAEIVVRTPNLIVTHGTPASLAVKGATAEIPVVLVSIGDPVGTGLVASLSKPGGNITGVSNIDIGLTAKRLELLKETVSGLAHVAVLHNSTNPSSKLQLEETAAAARKLGLRLQLADVRTPGELAEAFAAVAKHRCEGMTVLADPMFIGQRGRISELALMNRLPTVYARVENVEAGGLMSYGPRLVDQFAQGAAYIDKILKGAKPSDLPVEQPIKFELVINLNTARSLGLTVPSHLQLRADRTIG
jgi:putative ABC transport system substrate-binding protein